jgi:predicted nucleic acid-binding Zn ribbon protein
VICLKHHLDNISALAKEKLDYDMKDLDSVPSVNLRSLIEQAQRCPNQTSAELKDTLVRAGLINKGAGANEFMMITSRPHELSNASTNNE